MTSSSSALGDFARVARVYLDADSPHWVVAFTVNERYIEADELDGLPVVPFETLTETHPPDRYAMFVAIGFSGVNRARREVYEQCKEHGYELISYVNSKATYWGELVLGDNCFVFEENVIQPNVRIGNNVILWSGNHIGHDSTIEDHVFIASHAVISGNVTIGESSFVGVNATFRDGDHSRAAMRDRCRRADHEGHRRGRGLLGAGDGAAREEELGADRLLMRWAKRGLRRSVSAARLLGGSHAMVPVRRAARRRRPAVLLRPGRATDDRSPGAPTSIPANLTRFDSTVLAARPGPLGAFDDSGAMGSCLVEHEGRKYLYYIGWSRGVTVPFYTFIGCAIERGWRRDFRAASRPLRSSSEAGTTRS